MSQSSTNEMPVTRFGTSLANDEKPRGFAAKTVSAQSDGARTGAANRSFREHPNRSRIRNLRSRSSAREARAYFRRVPWFSNLPRQSAYGLITPVCFAVDGGVFLTIQYGLPSPYFSRYVLAHESCALRTTLRILRFFARCTAGVIAAMALE